ncbi:MAG TPA: enolase C-terminal domain-like protein [Dongiaceae bacterium]|nr:enolase C-terminal domain-like protein [Dongiaceae bacterium]
MDSAIDRIEAWACTLPLPKPLRFGSFEVRSREYAAVRLRTRGGLVADGLAQTRRAPVDVAVLDLLGPALLGRDALDIDARRADLALALRALERDGVFARAVSLLEICLQDLKAQAAGLPLWRLHRASAEPLDVLLVEGYEMAPEDDEAFAERLLARGAEGYRLMKLEAAHYETPELLARRVEAIRRRAGEGLRLVLDFAWAWTEADRGLRYAAPLRGLGIEWLEDPFGRERVEDYVRLRREAGIPVGAGDETTRPEQMRRLIEADALHVARIDANTLGGLGPAEEVARLAAGRGLRVSFHERPEVHQHAAFGWGLADHIEVFPTDRPFDCAHMLICEPVFERIAHGRLAPPAAPGTGLRLDDEALARTARRTGRLGHG